jgi:hypothetical protein
MPPWAVAGLLALAVLLAVADSVTNLALSQLTGRVTHLEHQVCLLEHRPHC